MRLLVRLALIVLISAAAAEAKPLKKEDVPGPLKPWVGWVLAGQEGALCPFLHGVGERQCAWPSSLALAVDAKGGRFSQSWRLFAETWVPLPGDGTRWPLDVRVDGAPAAVIVRGEGPRVLVPEGRHTVSGVFRWDRLPELLPLPSESGLLALTVMGKPVRFPNRDQQGRLWLHKERAVETEESRLETIVHRQVIDEVPLRLNTSVRLKVSGRNREVVLGKALPEGFTPLSITGPLPARLEPDGSLRVQVRPGTWMLTLAARHEGPAKTLTLHDAGGSWDTDEVWVFEARSSVRVVSVEGVSAIDPQQTELPPSWRSLPAYLMRAGDVMKLVEHRRGDADPAADTLNLNRTFWLDFAGRGLTVHDKITGTLRRSWRMEMGARTKLGRVAVGSRDQFITSLKEGGPSGVQVRRGKLALEADSRIEGSARKVPAVGWSHDFHKVNGRIHLPPGWSMIHARGVDKASPTWVSSWSLLDLFLVLIISLSIAKLWDRRWGLLALGAVVLCWHEAAAPRWVWLFLLAGEALSRALPDGVILKVVHGYRWALRGLLVLIAIPFLVLQVRNGIYPQLDKPRAGRGFISQAKNMAMIGGAASAVPASPAQLQEMDYDIGEEGAVAGALDNRMLKAKRRPKKSPGRLRQSESKSYYRQLANIMAPDPNARVSTGPGLPNWSWRTIRLSWRGPVDADQQLRLWLVGPAGNLFLSLIRAVLIVILVLHVLGLPVRRWWEEVRSRARGARAAAILALLLPLALPAAARAEMPSPEILGELRSRLLEDPDCAPECAQIPRMSLEASGRTLLIRLEISAAARTAVPLPGDIKSWTPVRVLLGGEPARSLRRRPDGTLWLAVPKGNRQAVLEGPLPERDTVQLPLPLKPRRVEARTRGWTLDGVREDGIAEDNLQLTRVKTNKSASRALEPGELPPFVRVVRTLRLGLSWQVETVVTRVSPLGTAIVTEVPLLAGESVTSAGVGVEKGKAFVSMGPRSPSVAWLSVLKESPEITLKAPKSVPWVEVWKLDAGPVWHVVPKGIPTIHPGEGAGAQTREWRPWPGEELSLAVTRPKGVAGRTFTIDRAELLANPGLRSTDATLDLSFRSSRGAQHPLILPEGAVIQSLKIDGRSQPVRQEDRKVTLTVTPGSHRARLEWRQKGGIGARYRTPRVDLGAESVNATLRVSMPRDRWTLALGGPSLGPPVLFWPLLIVFFAVSMALGRVPLTPLRGRHWFLLSLGLTQVPVPIAAIVTGWLLALGWRRARPAEDYRTFDAAQVGLALLTVLALACLIGAIFHDLLGRPDMQIAGNGSSSHTLQWYQDRSGSALPTAWILSVPLWIYRGFVLAWALWLAWALVRWLKWGWTCVSEGGLWKMPPPKKDAPPPPQGPGGPPPAPSPKPRP